MKKIACILLLIMMVGVFAGCTAKSEGVTVGITQIVEHPALDGAREGFIEALNEKGFVEGEGLTIDYKNAQGDMATAQTIANGFVSSKVDMIFAIATPTAQAAYNATKDIPILITAVTDPVSSGLANSMEKSETNVTGTSDMAPIGKQFDLLKQLVPDAKKVGIVYNTGEANSGIQVEIAKKEADRLGLEIIEKGVTNINEVDQALGALLNEMDVLYVPTDNMIASSMALISAKTIEAGIPVIGSEGAHVEQGALATEGIDYFQLGYQTGLMAVDVMEGKKPEEISLATLENTELIINQKTAEVLGITIPDDLKEKATMK